MALNFPSTPSNNQVYTDSTTGNSYKYRADYGLWVYNSGAIAAATGGGTDQIFWENGTSVTTNYSITTGKNAMTAGPINIADGVEVTITDGSTWTIV